MHGETVKSVTLIEADWLLLKCLCIFCFLYRI